MVGDLALDYRSRWEPVVPDVPEGVVPPALRELDRLQGTPVYVHPDDGLGAEPPEAA